MKDNFPAFVLFITGEIADAQISTICEADVVT